MHHALIIVLGNALVVGLEGLIVSVQTTRLVLFEFFDRFLHASGRPFRPLQLERTHCGASGTDDKGV